MIMNYRGFSIAALALVSLAGCGTIPTLPELTDTGAGNSGGAAIVGRIAASNETAKLLASASGSECPEVHVRINGAPVSIEFGDDCAFVINEIQPAELIEVRVELVALGVAGTVELSRVLDGELIEITVEPGDDSLSVSVERRTSPVGMGAIPLVVEGNGVSIKVGAGFYEQGLWVKGNKFTLVGEAGEGCGTRDGWTVITGEVLVEGNSATFRNVHFAGPVTIKGNNPRFINCCFGDQLVIFGNNASVGGKGDDHDDDDDDGGGGDDDDDGDDD
jgi:hypothetical protein